MTSNDPRPTPQPVSTTTVNNTSTGTVGIQAAHVTGSSVWMSTTPEREQVTDPTRALAELRLLLDHHRAQGALDDEDYDAAQRNLANAEKALRDPDAKGQKKAVTALRQFGGLVAHLTDLAAKTAVVITAMNGLA